MSARKSAAKSSLKSKPRVVLDTNIFVSALLGGRVCAGILDALTYRRFVLVLSPAIIDELQRVLEKPKLRGHATEARRNSFLDAVANAAHLVAPSVPLAVCRDPADNHVLEVAIEGRAQFIVTGDTDLLVLHPFCGVAIIKPADFLGRVVTLPKA